MSVVYNFSGKVAIVTGASIGIGRAMARHLKDAGADVWVWDLNSGKDKDFHYQTVDVTRAEQIDAALSELLKATRQLDIVINNAGIVGTSSAVTDLDPGDWRRIVDVNLTGVFEVSRQVVPHLVRARAGRMVNIASIAGKEGTPFLAPYSAAKAGVIAFTKSLAKELAETNVRVNAIAPAAIETDILKQMAPDVVAMMVAKSPMKRLGEVDEAAELAMWLCSEACTFSTGATFDLSGGRATY
jgi:3-oxoacyl-[acyl-carrier protein] reductase